MPWPDRLSAPVARLHGAGNKSIVVRDDLSGEVVHSPNTLSAHDRACVSVAGAIAEARFLDHRHWKKFLSQQDWENIIALAESAAISSKYHAFFLDNIARAARTMLVHRWPDVERVVSFLYESAGPIRLKPGERLLYETLAPTPPPTQPTPPRPAPGPDISAGLGRLARRSAELWSADSPHETASHRRLYESSVITLARLFETADTDGGWITIGAHRGADGKKHGGTPVKIKGGKITHGPPGLAGKTLRGLSKTKPHLELRRAINRAHKEHGFSKSDIADAIEFVNGERKRVHDERESAKEHARKLTGLSAGDISRLSNAGHDYASGAKAGGLTGEKLRHFDQFAQEAAREHPELGLGDPDSGDDFHPAFGTCLARASVTLPPSIIKTQLMRQSSFFTRTPDTNRPATRCRSNMGNTFRRRHWRPDYGQRNHDRCIVQNDRQLISGPELSRQTGVPLGAINKLARGGLLPVAGNDDRDYPLFDLANPKVAEWLKAVRESSDGGSLACSEAMTDENGSPRLH